MATRLFNSSFVLPPANPLELPPEMLTTLCASDRPLALLPVRLETRFFARPDGSSELRVRIYPDKIHLDSHEPELSPGEREWATHYWEQDWRAGNDAAGRLNAWRQLANRFGVARAAWIARALAPTNPQDRPAAPVPAGQALPRVQRLPEVVVVRDGPEVRWRDVVRAMPTPRPVVVVDDGENASWRRPPLAQLLPDRWVAVLQSGGRIVRTVTGRNIARPLAVGPDPQSAVPGSTAGVNLPDDTSAVEPAMRWMVDFDVAEAAGMALRIVVPAAILTIGLDNLIVLGVAASTTAADTATQLSDLLDAHHYTDGLEFLRLGTPTNNTADRRAGSGVDEPGRERSFALEVATAASALDPASNAARLGLALGLPAGRVAPVLGHVGQADEQHEASARSMNTALWPVGWGYFLSNMLGFDHFEYTGLTPDAVAWGREHFVAHVRGAGPYPAVRCGRQPYGVLPVTSIDQWRPPTGEEQALVRDSWLKAWLMTLRDEVWRTHLPQVRRVGLRGNDPDGDLADVMGTDAFSHTYGTRAVFGRRYLQHLRVFLGERPVQDGFIAAQDAIAAGFLSLDRLVCSQLGTAPRVLLPRLAKAVFADLPWLVSSPLVQAGEVSPWRRLEPNYIATLLAQPSIESLIESQPDPASSDGTSSLLQALLRHALLRELAQATATIAATSTDAAANEFGVGVLLRDAELVDFVATSHLPLLSFTRQLALRSPAVTGDKTIRQFLDGLTTFDAPAVASLGEFRRSLGHLQGLDSETLQFLMQSTLDLSAHRLDAWITSFATKRLSAMRAVSPEGVYVGGYGWVENLRPTPPSVAPPVTPPPGEQSPLVANANDSGFIHAPSLTHAAAAALLRNAHLGPTGVPQPGDPFAIDLSSRRVREAARLLAGVREGQPLGALLGYRFERGLHELGLDRFIHRLRELAPLAASKVAGDAGSVEATAASNVVDGLELHRKWRDETAVVTAALRQAHPSPSRTELESVTQELHSLGDAIDGLSDALTAETAYQMARGNTARVASTLSAIAQGDAPAPELEVARIPRSGTAITHRLLVLRSATPASAPGWTAATDSARATAEPIANAWAARLLGDPGKVRCTVEQLHPTTGKVVETRVLRLSELGLAPLDVVYGVEATTVERQDTASTSEVERRILYHALHMAGGFAPESVLRLQHAPPGDLAGDELTLLDVVEQARAARQLFAAARGADAEDLNPPERADNGVTDLPELEGRVATAEGALVAAHEALTTLVRTGDAPAEALRAGLMKLGGFGIGPAVPVVVSGDDAAARAGLATQASALLKDSAVRVDKSAMLRGLPAAADARARCNHLVERMRSVFGAAFLVLPRFTCDAAAATELASALAASTQAQNGDPLAANTWLLRCARVRENAMRLGTCLRTAEVLSTGERLNLSVAQLPFSLDERWIGLPPDAGKDPVAGKLSLVVQASADIDVGQPLAGMWIDEWTEIVPSRRETTALTFQFNPPDACAPQCVLLAVPPAPGEAWSIASLHRVLVETLDLAKLRAVAPNLLSEPAQYLPGLYLAFNAKNAAVSTNFAPLTKGL